MRISTICKALTAALFAFCVTATAGPLRLLSSGGPESAFGALTFSESDIDTQRPAFLLNINRGQLSFNKEIESIVNQKKAGQMLHLATAKKNRVDFFYPINKNRKYKSAYAGNRYTSDFKLFTNDSNFQNTYTYNKGAGSSNAFAQQFGPLAIGYFKNTTRNTGSGLAAEINNKISFLDSTATALSLLKAKKEGLHYTLRLNNRLSASYMKSNEDISTSIRFADAADDYTIPLNISGEHREAGVLFKVSNRYSVRAFINHASYDSLDDIYYNNTLNLYRWLTAAEYDVKSFYLKKVMSPNRTRLLGFEDYDGYFRLAGAPDPDNILGPIILTIINWDRIYHAHGLLHRRTFKYASERKKGNYTYRFQYAYSTGSASVHYDSERCVWGGCTREIDDNYNYDFTQHQLGLGIEKNISKDTIFRYSILQVIPLLEKTETQPAAAPAPGTPATPTQKKDTRGGTTHLFSIIFII